MIVAGVNRAGKDSGVPTTRKHFGSSMVVNHLGEVMTRAGSETDEIVYADLDPAPLREFRSFCGYYRDRRPEIYSAISQS